MSGSVAPAGGRAGGSRDGRRSREEDIRDVWGIKPETRREEGERAQRQNDDEAAGGGWED